MVPGPELPRRRHAHRPSVGFVVLLALLAFVLGRPADPVSASADDEAAFVEALNEVRAEQGLPPFVVNTELADLARAHAALMADAGEIFHAERISTGYGGPWSKLGENVGVGADVAVLIDAFVASPGHYANIIDPAFTEVGVGVVWRDAALYTTHRFLQPPGPVVPPTTAPPVTTTAPPPSPSTPSDPPATSLPPDPEPTTTTSAPADPAGGPAIRAERVVALLALLEELGT
jgi:hypothetical protein